MKHELTQERTEVFEFSGILIMLAWYFSIVKQQYSGSLGRPKVLVNANTAREGSTFTLYLGNQFVCS